MTKDEKLNLPKDVYQALVKEAEIQNLRPIGIGGVRGFTEVLRKILLAPKPAPVETASETMMIHNQKIEYWVPFGLDHAVRLVGKGIGCDDEYMSIGLPSGENKIYRRDAILRWRILPEEAG